MGDSGEASPVSIGGLYCASNVSSNSGKQELSQLTDEVPSQICHKSPISHDNLHPKFLLSPAQKLSLPCIDASFNYKSNSNIVDLDKRCRIPMPVSIHSQQLTQLLDRKR